MKDIHKSRLARLSIALLDATKKDRIVAANGKSMMFDMKRYSASDNGTNLRPGEVHDCGTSCCFLGYAPLVFSEELKIMPRLWSDLADWVLGKQPWLVTGHSTRFDLVFGCQWPNDPKQAVRRALAVCRDGRLAKSLTLRVRQGETPRCYQYLSDKRVRESLMQFVLP